MLTIEHDSTGKGVSSWLGNSPTVANNHYAMTMQASFDRAVIDGAKIVGVTTTPPAESKPGTDSGLDDEVVTSNVPPKVPQTLQDKLPLSRDTKKADCENPAINWVCLASALGDLPLSYPASVPTEYGETGNKYNTAGQGTQHYTQVPLRFSGIDELTDCLQQLPADQLAELMQQLAGTPAA